MSTAVILPPVELLAAAAAELSAQARERQEYATMRAIDKAALQLHEGTSPVPTIGGWLLESRTRPGVVHRISVAHGCSCEAALNSRVCWHTQLMAVLEHAAQSYTMPALTQQQAQEAIDELFV